MTYNNDDLKNGIGFSSTVNLWTNTMIIGEVFRVILITWGIFFIMMLLIGGFDMRFALSASGITGAILLGLTLVGYYGIYCPLNKGHFRNNYVMTDKQITGYMGVQTAETADKITTAAIVAGILTGSPSTIGVGVLSSRREMTTKFRDIKAITIKRRHSAIVLSAGLERNVIFVPDGYLDSVANTIIQHSPATVKVKGQAL